MASARIGKNACAGRLDSVQRAALPSISHERSDEGEPELMALYWTVSGPVEVHAGREWSLFDWRDRCAEAARVGFKGLGLWHADVSHQLESRSLDEMAKIFRDAGLKYLEVEFLWEFFVPPASRPGPTPTGCASSCSRPPSHSTPTTSRSATSPRRRASSTG